MKKAGIVLLIIGLVVTLVTGVSFFTKEKVVDIGKVEITKDKKHTASWSPLWGVGIMVLGGALILLNKKA
jgi:Ca2+/H+ antiporter